MLRRARPSPCESQRAPRACRRPRRRYRHHDDQGAKTKAPSALDYLGDSTDMDDTLKKLFLFRALRSFLLASNLSSLFTALRAMHGSPCGPPRAGGLTGVVTWPPEVSPAHGRRKALTRPWY